MNTTGVLPTFITNEVSKEGDKFVLFMGNLLDDNVKFQNPSWELGGVIVADFNSLKYRNGYLRQGEIVPLATSMEAVSTHMVIPEERPQWIKNFTGYIPDENGKMVKHEFNSNQTKCLYKKRYPIDDVAKLVSRQNGIVEFPLQNMEKLKEAQYFLFPDWNELTLGVKTLPKTSESMLLYLQGRLSSATTQEQKDWVVSAINSVKQFRLYANNICLAINGELRRNTGFSSTQFHQELSVFSGVQLEDARREENYQRERENTAGLSQIGNGLEELAKVQAMMAQILANQQNPQNKQTVAVEEANLINIGDEVTYEKREATVTKTGLPFGRVEITFADNGETKQVSKSGL